MAAAMARQQRRHGNAISYNRRGRGGVVPIEITLIDTEDEYKKYVTLRLLRYIYSNPFRFLIYPWACLIFLLRKAERERWQNILPMLEH
jgi:hypothetical protein